MKLYYNSIPSIFLRASNDPCCARIFEALKSVYVTLYHGCYEEEVVNLKQNGLHTGLYFSDDETYASQYGQFTVECRIPLSSLQEIQSAMGMCISDNCDSHYMMPILNSVVDNAISVQDAVNRLVCLFTKENLADQRFEARIENEKEDFLKDYPDGLSEDELWDEMRADLCTQADTSYDSEFILADPLPPQHIVKIQATMPEAQETIRRMRW